MSEQESGTAEERTGDDARATSLIRLQLTLWEQRL